MKCKNMNIQSITHKSRRDDTLLAVGFSLRSEPSDMRYGIKGKALKSISVGQRPTNGQRPVLLYIRLSALKKHLTPIHLLTH